MDIGHLIISDFPSYVTTIHAYLTGLVWDLDMVKESSFRDWKFYACRTRVRAIFLNPFVSQSLQLIWH